MRTHQYAHKKRASQSLRSSFPRPSSVQSSVQPPQIQAKSNEEGLAEHAERLRKFERLGNSLLDMGPPKFGNDKTSPVQPQPWIQKKLTIGQSGDKYEQEADRVATQVVQQINAPAFSQSNQGQSVQRKKAQYGVMQANCIRAAIQRKQAIAGGEASPNLESAINSAKGSGQPLDARLQQSMGQAMDADFSGVRVHTDTQSDQLNQSIQARAFTTGQDVFFREGAYQPGNRGGQELIAHELTHVLQQNTSQAVSPMVQCEFIVAGEDHDEEKKKLPGRDETYRDKEREWAETKYKNYWIEYEFMLEHHTAQKQLKIYGSSRGDPPPILIMHFIEPYLPIHERHKKIRKKMFESYKKGNKYFDSFWIENRKIIMLHYGWVKKNLDPIKFHTENWFNEIDQWTKSKDYFGIADKDPVLERIVEAKPLGTEVCALINKLFKLLDFEKQQLNENGEFKGEDEKLKVEKVLPGIDLINEKLEVELNNFNIHLSKWRKDKNISLQQERSFAMHQAAVIGNEFGKQGLWKVGDIHVDDIFEKFSKEAITYNLHREEGFNDIRNDDNEWKKLVSPSIDDNDEINKEEK